MDNHIGTLDWEACETCVHRAAEDADNDDCQTQGPDLEVEMGDWVICSLYEEGDPPTQEEMEAEAEKKRKSELDQKYQIKLID